jgi:hypothetical protein
MAHQIPVYSSRRQQEPMVCHSNCVLRGILARPSDQHSHLGPSHRPLYSTVNPHQKVCEVKTFLSVSASVVQVSMCFGVFSLHLCTDPDQHCRVWLWLRPTTFAVGKDHQ